MIKVDLITGFLGSGKTTFLLNYAKYLMSQGLRIGILEYDYGAVNVDMMLLKELRGEQCELEMVAAGCDADCLERRFRTKLISMAMSGYDRVIIEPSGVFDMDMFFDTLREEPLENWYEIGSVMTIVNANLKENIRQEDNYFLASQALGAGCVIFSRTQLSDEAHINQTKEHIEHAIETIHGTGFIGRYLEKDWSSLTDEDYQMLTTCGYRISSYIKKIAGQRLQVSSVCFLDLKDTLESLKEKIKVLFDTKDYGTILRVKGFVVDAEESYQINASEYEMMVDSVNTDKGVLIVIGADLKEEKIAELIGATVC